MGDGGAGDICIEGERVRDEKKEKKVKKRRREKGVRERNTLQD